MRLDERAWMLPAGLTPDWRWVAHRRLEQSLLDLDSIAKVFSKDAPSPVRRRLYFSGMRYFLKHKSAARDLMALHPSFDYWLFLWHKHFSAPCQVKDWNLQFGLFQGFSACLAAATRGKGEFDLILDPDAHLHFYGSSAFFEFPKAAALKSVRLVIGNGWMAIYGPDGISARLPREALLAPTTTSRHFGKISLRYSPEIIPGISIESCAFLMTHGVVMHGLAHPSATDKNRFGEVLRVAFSHIQERSPALYAEMTDMVRALIPLVNPVGHGSVSSSYVSLRGAICLSHSEDPLLQAETLIHEFCHQKMNQLLLADPILIPGQTGQVFYSPWRPDARRLRGLILGAHAFLNVADYLVKSLEREKYELRSKIAIMCNVARRLFEVDAALHSACAYGQFTEFGRRFILGLCREMNGLFHAVQWFPPALINEARTETQRHRREFALPLTGIYKNKDFVAIVRPIPYGKPNVIRRKKP